MAFNLQDALEDLASHKANTLRDRLQPIGEPNEEQQGFLSMLSNPIKRLQEQQQVSDLFQKAKGLKQQEAQVPETGLQALTQPKQLAAQQKPNPLGIQERGEPFKTPVVGPKKEVEQVKKAQVAEETQEQKAIRAERKKAARERTREQLANQPKLTAKQKEAESKYVDKLSALYEGAQDGDKRLNRMEKLIDKGNLPNATFYTLFKNLEEHVNPAHAAAAGAGIGAYAGGPVGAAIGGSIGGLIQPVATLLRGVQKQVAPDTEEFEKLSNDFVKNAKSIFGSRLTDADLKAFLSTVPTLSQTDQGKMQIIKNMKSFNEASKIRYEAMRDIIRENDNKIPANLELLVNDRAKDELDELAQKFGA